MKTRHQIPIGGIDRSLPPYQFSSVIKWVKTADKDRLNDLMKMFGDAKNRLCIRQRSINNKAVQGVPEGSDHFDSGSLLDWLGAISKTDVGAIEQVAVIYATIQDRLQG